MDKDKVIAELQAAIVTLRKAGAPYGGDTRASLYEAAGVLERWVIRDIKDGTWSRLYHDMKDGKHSGDPQ